MPRVVLMDVTLAEAEKLLIEEALLFHISLALAAEALGISEKSLKARMKKHGIQVPRGKDAPRRKRKEGQRRNSSSK